MTRDSKIQDRVKVLLHFLNGEEGILRYRGYSIEELCEKSSFIEVAFLLIFGELPQEKRLSFLIKKLKYDSLVDERLKDNLKEFS